jgi:uncharacterized protein
MTVVIDCNIMVMCLTSRSKYHFIYQSLVKGKFKLAISVEIILEYEEIIQNKYGIATANAFIALLKELPNVHYMKILLNHIVFYTINLRRNNPMIY